MLVDLAEQCLRAGLLTIVSTGLPRAADRAELRARFRPEQLVELTCEGGDRGLPVRAEDPDGAFQALLAELQRRNIVPS